MRRKAACTIAIVSLLNIILLTIGFMCGDNLKCVTVLSVIQLIVNVFAIILINQELMLIGLVFLLLTYLFNFGQSIITTFGFNDIYAHRNVLSQVVLSDYISAELFAMTSMFAITWGYLFVCGRNKRGNERRKGLKYSDENLLGIRHDAILIFMIALLPMVYLDVLKIAAYLSGGYMSTYLTYQNGIAKYLSLIAQFGKPAISVLLYAYSSKPKVARNILIVSTLYLLVMMISGDRGSNVIYIITHFFIYYSFVKKLKLRHVFGGALAAFGGLFALSVISILRDYELSIETLKMAMEWRAGDGVIYATLREFGGSVLSLVHAIDYIPEYSNYNYGMTYLAGIFSIVPAIPDSLALSLEKSTSFVRAFPTSAAGYTSLGGSYLGELYFNFGWFGSIVAVLIGCFLGKMDTLFVTISRPKWTAVMIVLMPSLILWTRDFFSGLIFKTFWFGFFILCFRVARKRTEIRKQSPL